MNLRTSERVKRTELIVLSKAPKLGWTQTSRQVLKIKPMTWVEHKFITAGLAAQITYEKSITATHT